MAWSVLNLFFEALGTRAIYHGGSTEGQQSSADEGHSLCIFVEGFADEVGLEPTVLVSDPSMLTSKSGPT